MRIEKYNSRGLGALLESEIYRTMPFIPVSGQRALSWLHNPRLKPDDVIMYLAFEEEDMIAYRCILPDRHGNIRFGWLSGNWVRPDRRRQGIASRLLEEAYADWGHQLMYTNYAPESKAVYDKTGHFELYHSRPGMRFYQRSSASNLLGGRRPIFRRSRLLLKAADGMLNLVQDIRIRTGREVLKEIDFAEGDRVDLETLGFLERNKGTGFSARGLDEFTWITDWPWIIAGKDRDPRYFFSSISPVFRNICLKIRDPEGGLAGFIWLVVKGEAMTIPYTVFPPELAAGVSDLVKAYMQQTRIAYLTSYHAPLLEAFEPGPILGKKRISQHYFATRDLIRQLPSAELLNFQDGDGDVVFV